MKKLLVFFYVIIVILSFSTVKAYSTDTYEISIPDSYVKSENTWQLDKENEKVTIVINVDKNNNKLNFEDYNEEKLKEDQYIKELEDEFKNNNESITIKSSDISFTNLNNHKAIKMDIITDFKDQNYNSNVYQTQYIVASKNYVYYILISSSSKEKLNSEEVNNIVDSLVIKDDKAKKDQSLTKHYLSIGLIISMAVFIFVLSRRKRF